MRTFAYLVAVLGLCAAWTLPAQAQWKVQSDLAFNVGIPQGEFEQNVDDLGYGANLFVGVGVGRSPVVLGVDAGFLVYGHERREVPLSTTIPDVTVDVTTSNNIVPVHGVLRIQPPGGMVRPYVDGLFGFKYLFTQTSVSGDDNSEAFASSTNVDDAALSYGLGGGLDVHLYRWRTEEGRPMALQIHAGARYLFGGEAEYLQKGAIERRNGQVFFETQRSETSLLVTQFGVTFRF